MSFLECVNASVVLEGNNAVCHREPGSPVIYGLLILNSDCKLNHKWIVLVKVGSSEV